MRLRPRVRAEEEQAYPPATALVAWQAYVHARHHWASCQQCRNAAQALSAEWCELGLQLMSEGDATSSHWDTCHRCQEVQANVRARQCSRGRELDDQYRISSQRLATLQRVD